MDVFHLEIVRYYSPMGTLGKLLLNSDLFGYTIERPCVPDINGGIAGMPFKSCVPEGEYELEIFNSPKRGYEVLLFHNDDLGVVRLREDQKRKNDRYLTEIHVGNDMEDVVGCAAVGASFGAMDNLLKVWNSKVTFGKLMAYAKEAKELHLTIRPYEARW